jgi:serine/threonine protein kinase
MKCPKCQHENPENTRYCGQCGRELSASRPGEFPETVAYQTPTKALDRGTTFARRFEIIEEIGQGGMGTVYKAYDNKIKEVVALKLLKPEISSDLEIIDRFRNELKLARKVAHRHVCRMYDLNEEGLSFYISMEYVPGEDLKSFIRRSGHLNEAKALDLARQIADGLAEAHRLGVIHRDLKPHNIMIDREGNAKIMDFGIARSLHTRGMTTAGLIVGTPEYMSPEQAEARNIDLRSDIYSLGVILYEMVTGRVPFEGETPLSIALKHRTEAPTDPKTLNTQISPGFSRIILRCLEKAREDRYQSAEAIVADIDRVEKGQPAAWTPAARRGAIATREITVKFSLKKLLVPGLAVAVLIVAAALIIKSRTGRGLETPVRPPLTDSRGAGGSGRTDFQRSRDSGRSPVTQPGVSAKPAPPTPSQLSQGWNLIAPFLRQYTSSLESGNAQEVAKALADLRAKIPRDAPYAGLLDNIQGQFQKGKDLGLAGKAEASERSYSRGESEMRKLLTLVSDKERADLARQEMDVSKKKAEESAKTKGLNLLGWIAAEKEKDATDSYQKNDFTGARILYGILNRVYLLSIKGGNEDQCLAALRDLASMSRTEAEKAQAPDKEGWLYALAKEDEAAAVKLTGDKAYAFAAEAFIKATFLYEKAREVSLESAQAGR